MYPDLMVIPMREELTRAGVQEALTPEEVDAAVCGTRGVLMVVVNSICGCAAGKMRPAVRAVLEGPRKPDHTISVFAGQDVEATQRARGYFTGQPHSSPCIGILRDGKLVFFMPRADIEDSDADGIAATLNQVFEGLRLPAAG